MQQVTPVLYSFSQDISPQNILFYSHCPTCTVIYKIKMVNFIRYGIERSSSLKLITTLPTHDRIVSWVNPGQSSLV